jgi:hypothetical protein
MSVRRVVPDIASAGRPRCFAADIIARIVNVPSERLSAGS